MNLVVGRNTIKGVPVDTFNYLKSMAIDTGFEVEMEFNYEIIKNSFKISRHETANIINTDGVAILSKG